MGHTGSFFLRLTQSHRCTGCATPGQCSSPGPPHIPCPVPWPCPHCPSSFPRLCPSRCLHILSVGGQCQAARTNPPVPPEQEVPGSLHIHPHPKAWQFSVPQSSPGHFVKVALCAAGLGTTLSLGFFLSASPPTSLSSAGLFFLGSFLVNHLRTNPSFSLPQEHRSPGPVEGGTWERSATPFVLGSCVCTLLASVLTEGEWVGGESSAALQWRCCLSFPLALSGH